MDEGVQIYPRKERYSFCGPCMHRKRATTIGYSRRYRGLRREGNDDSDDEDDNDNDKREGA